MTETRKIEYDAAYMNMAIALSKLSYAVRNKVGCIIVSEDGQIISQGFNGTPSGMDNCCEIEVFDGYKSCSTDRYCPHDLRCSCSLCNEYGIPTYKLVTKPEVLHAESNAISKCAKWATVSTNNSTLYVTLSPCIDCAKLIIQAGIKRVVFYDTYRNMDGLDFLVKNGIIVDRINIENNTIEKWEVR